MYHCNYCQEDITGIRMKCAECTDFDLCLQCFGCGAEIGNHKRDHNYQFIDCGNLPIFKNPNAWKSREEVMLLEAIEQYGLGNWEDVSECVDDRDVEEVKEHYNNMYVFGSVGRATWTVENNYVVKDHTCPEGGPLSPSLATPVPPPELTSPEQQELGYMPYRDDFEREYENEVEALACNLAMTNEDEDIDVALKLAHIDMYSQKLKERLRRKRIAREYQLVAQFFSAANKTKVPTPKKKQTREEKEFQEKMQLFCQFHSSAEHDQFFENLQKEKELKSRIKELMRYRRNGLTKVDDCSSFETARYRREKRKENKKKSGSTASSAHRRSTLGSKKQEEKGGDTTTEEHEDDKKEERREVDISSLPGYELLSEREKKLCTSIRLKPSYYLTFKTILLKDHLQKQQGNPVKVRYPAGLDKAHRRKIMSVLVGGGFLSSS